MIILKEQPLPDLPTPYDAPPPSYHHSIESSSSTGSTRSQNRQAPPKHPHRDKPSSTPSPSPPQSSNSSPTFAAIIESGKSKLKSSLIDLIGGGIGQSTKDVKNMAYRTVVDVVKHPEAQQSMALIDTCAHMCQTKGVNFSEILQGPVLEGHRALYWIIVSRPFHNQYGLISTILKHCGSLSPEAVDEVRLACLQVGDQTLFSHIWNHPAYGALSGTDELVLGARSPTDRVEVTESMVDEIGAFVARFEITQFHKRMTISGGIVFEFIARGRLWYLKFCVTPDKKTNAPGPWAMSLSITNPSPPTWLDSRVVVLCPRGKSGKSPHLPAWPLPKDSAVGSLLSSSTPDLRREKPPIQFRLQTKTQQLQPPTSTKARTGRNELVAYFSENAASSGLQFPDSAYYSPDGTLQVTVEGRLTKPVTDAGCVIC